MSRDSQDRSSVWATTSTPRALLRHGVPGTAWQRHSAITEHVGYRYDPEYVPAITYHSMPHMRVGGADTLDDARKSYRFTMTRLFDVSRHELPPAVEHLEALVAGTWVRTKVGAVHRDPISGRMFLQTLLSAGPAQHALRDHLQLAASRGPTPVVVIVEPDDTLDALFAQMRAEDALLVAHADPQDAVGWVALYGPNACGIDDARHIAEHAEVRMMPIEALTRACADADSRALRFDPYQLHAASRSDVA
jgi:hypothetical protein